MNKWKWESKQQAKQQTAKRKTRKFEAKMCRQAPSLCIVMIMDQTVRTAMIVESSSISEWLLKLTKSAKQKESANHIFAAKNGQSFKKIVWKNRKASKIWQEISGWMDGKHTREWRTDEWNCICANERKRQICGRSESKKMKAWNVLVCLNRMKSHWPRAVAEIKKKLGKLKRKKGKRKRWKKKGWIWRENKFGGKLPLWITKKKGQYWNKENKEKFCAIWEENN